MTVAGRLSPAARFPLPAASFPLPAARLNQPRRNAATSTTVDMSTSRQSATGAWSGTVRTNADTPGSKTSDPPINSARYADTGRPRRFESVEDRRRHSTFDRTLLRLSLAGVG